MPPPVSHPRSLAVPTSATNFPRSARLRVLRWNGEDDPVRGVRQVVLPHCPPFSTGPHLLGAPRAGCPVGGIPRPELGHRQSP